MNEWNGRLTEKKKADDLTTAETNSRRVRGDQKVQKSYVSLLARREIVRAISDVRQCQSGVME
jgi:hypothetical protein